MNYIENAYICLAAPLLLAIMCLRKDGRRSLLFVVAGMTVCLFSAYISAFIAGAVGAERSVATFEITPVVEEIMKVLPVLLSSDFRTGETVCDPGHSDGGSRLCNL